MISVMVTRRSDGERVVVSKIITIHAHTNGAVSFECSKGAAGGTMNVADSDLFRPEECDITIIPEPT